MQIRARTKGEADTVLVGDDESEDNERTYE